MTRLALLVICTVPFAGCQEVAQPSDIGPDGLTLGASGTITPPQGLVSWWPGDGHANDIVGGNHGTLQNGATFAAGMVKQAFSFDGVNDFVDVPDHPSLSFGDGTDDGPFTFDAWIKLASLNRDHVIVSKFNSPELRAEYHFNVRSNNQLNISLFNKYSPPTDFRVQVNSAAAISDMNWHHIAVLYDGTEDAAGTSFYIDGVEQTTIVLSNDPGYVAMQRTGETFKIGRLTQSGVVSLHFHGLVDELELYNRALSADEIQAIYEAGKAGKQKPPVCVSHNGNTIRIAAAALQTHLAHGDRQVSCPT